MMKLLSLQVENYNGSVSEEITAAISELNEKYDDFIVTFGRINSKENAQAMMQDSSYHLIKSLEILDTKGEFVDKAAVMKKPLITPRKKIEHITNANDALIISLSEKFKVDIANQKGGVAKTTTAVNLGTALELSGKKVLLIDLDPQANMSSYLGFEDDDKETMSDLVMTAANNFTMGAQKRDMPVVGECIRHSEVNKVHYIPADIGLAYADACMMQAATRESVLKFILSDEEVREYDYVIIDCLPSLGILLINALAAADGVIIPVQTQKFALDGLDMLGEIYYQVKSTINSKGRLWLHKLCSADGGCFVPTGNGNSCG